MAKCAITGKKLNLTFLGKPLGTVIKDEKGKQYWISPEAQREYGNEKDKLLDAIKK